jgi:hypothetical protein
MSASGLSDGEVSVSVDEAQEQADIRKIVYLQVRRMRRLP